MSDATPDQPETMPVRFTVRSVEPVHGRGILVGLAVVEMDVSGVVFMLQGVQIIATPGSGKVECRAPMWRHPSRGTWIPGVLLPPELADVMAHEVLSEWLGRR